MDIRALLNEKDVEVVENTHTQIETSSHQTAFLIEGFEVAEEEASEVAAAVNLAKENHYILFDIISSYDDIHLTEAYKVRNETKLKLIMLSVIRTFLEDQGQLDQIIDLYLKGPYELLITEGFFKEFPAWLENLNSSTFSDFEKNIVCEYGSANEAIQALQNISYDMNFLSNKLSVEELLEYLKLNDAITTVYGLIGKYHLDILEMAGKVTNKTIMPDYCIYEGTIKLDRTIKIYLFGGRHKTMDHFNALKNFLLTKQFSSTTEGMGLFSESAKKFTNFKRPILNDIERVGFDKRRK